MIHGHLGRRGILGEGEDTVNLTQIPIEQLTAYLEQRITLAELRQWLADLAPAMATDDDSAPSALSDELLLLVSEYDYGHRDEADLRAAMLELLPAPWKPRYLTWGDQQPTRVATRASNTTPAAPAFRARVTEPGSWIGWSVDTPRSAASA
jgi:hypothetical protein